MVWVCGCECKCVVVGGERRKCRGWRHFYCHRIFLVAPPYCAVTTKDKAPPRSLARSSFLAAADRPVHAGTTGAYDSWPSLLFEALTLLDGGFASSVPYLAGVSAVSADGPFGQAHEIAADNTTAFKTSNGWTRYVANNGASFAEVVLRTLFGYSPTWAALPDGALPTPALSAEPRGIGGSLFGVRLPGTSGRTIDAELTAAGVAYTHTLP